MGEDSRSQKSGATFDFVLQLPDAGGRASIPPERGHKGPHLRWCRNAGRDHCFRGDAGAVGVFVVALVRPQDAAGQIDSRKSPFDREYDNTCALSV